MVNTDGVGPMWRLERVWRLIATSILYIVFGVGCIFFGVFIMLPLSLLFFALPEIRVNLWRRTIRFAFFMFVQLGQLLGVFKIHFDNAEELRKSGQMIIANHPSLLDVVILISQLPSVDCVIKYKISKNPFMSLQVWLADYVRNDSGEEVVHECARRLDNGHSIIVFPEGTRTKNEQPMKFLRGTARTILASNAQLRPVLIHCHPSAFGKNDPWYHIPETKVQYEFVVCASLNINSFRDSNRPESIRARRLTAWLEAWFAAKLNDTCPDKLPH